jgi:uncharacterized membrane protein YphA (DoxX/SURF4 family)
MPQLASPGEDAGGATRRTQDARVRYDSVARLSSRALDALGTILRLGLSGVWLTSGALKVVDPGQTYTAVNAYKVLPTGVVSVVAAALPFAELALGVLLLIGIGTRLVAALSVLLLLAFVAGVSQAWARGLSIDCGCFGGGGQVAAGQTQYPQELARDAGFLVLAVWLLVRSRSLLSLDRWLLRDRGGEPEAPPAVAG